ncbi:hypothetical protein GC175_05000 [bacterium]|nr:hypothetical protein [bacterium]
MAQLRTKYERENGHSYTFDEIEDMRPTAWRPDGTPTKFEIVQRDQAKPRVIGDDDDVQHIVSPLPEARVVRSSSHVEGSWRDRAEGFSISTWQLSAVTGVLFVVAAAVFGASLSFFTLALAFFFGFSAAWLIAYFLHVWVSAEGAQLTEVLLLWKFLFREQAHRHGRYSLPKSERQRTLETVLLAAAVGVTALAVLGLIVAVFAENMPR